MQKTRASFATAWVLGVVCLAVALPALADDHGAPLLADREDREIRRVIGPHLNEALKQMEDFGADAGIVYQERFYKTTYRETHLTENTVWWVREGEAEDLTNYVRDFGPGVEVGEVQAFVIRAGTLDVEAARAAAIERVEADRIHVTQADKDRFANLVIGLDTAQPGDLIGISIHICEKRPLDWEPWLLADFRPVARAELRLKCDDQRAFAVFGSRFLPGMMDQQVLYRKKGQITDLRITADTIPPMRNEPYAPPYHLQSPQLTVTWRASKINLSGVYRWIYYDSWNQIASDMALYEKEFLRKKKKTRKMAEKLVGDRPPADAIEDLYQFARDDLMSLNSWFYYEDDDVPHVDDILEARSGSPWEKAFLLLAMLREVGLDSEIVWAHDPEDGGYFDDYPSFGQVDNALVLVRVGGQEIWLDLECDACSPGQIRSKIRDVEAITYATQAQEWHEDLIYKAFREAQAKRVDGYSHYMDQLKGQDWHGKVRTPGRTGRYDAWCRESMVRDADDQVVVELQSVGRTGLAARIEAEGDAYEAGSDWVKSRFGEFDRIEAAGSAEGESDTLTLAFDVEGSRPAPPMGDTWILQPDEVFGQPCMESWPERRVTDFHVELNSVHIWEYRLPLPADWENVDIPRNRVIQAGPIAYQIQYAVRNGDFVVTRTLAEKAGTVRRDETIVEIGRKLGLIHDLETSPVILHRVEAGS